MKFATGQCYATPGALNEIERAGLSYVDLLARHVRGDWGDLSREDKAANDAAVHDGGRIFSSYRLPRGSKVWLITEAVGDDGSRAATTLLLPDEY